jgi:hypothetical protein
MLANIHYAFFNIYVSMIEPLGFKCLNYSIFAFQIVCTKDMHEINVRHLDELRW